MQLVLGYPVVIGADLKPFNIAVLVLAVYVAGQITAGPAKALLEDVIIEKVLKRPTDNLFRSSTSFLRGMFFPGYYKPLPKGVQERVLGALQTDLGKIPEGDERFLAVRYSKKVLSDERLLKRIDSFRDKYGFNRNIAFTALVTSTTLLVKGYMFGASELIHYGWIGFISGILLFYRYLKFFRQYSFEMFNCYAGSKEK
jgi:hypothetical protein